MATDGVETRHYRGISGFSRSHAQGNGLLALYRLKAIQEFVPAEDVFSRFRCQTRTLGVPHRSLMQRTENVLKARTVSLRPGTHPPPGRGGFSTGPCRGNRGNSERSGRQYDDPVGIMHDDRPSTPANVGIVARQIVPCCPTLARDSFKTTAEQGGVYRGNDLIHCDRSILVTVRREAA